MSDPRHASEAVMPDMGELRDRYPEVEAFAGLMRLELWANRGKGDQNVWRATEPKQLAYDVAWHLTKLMAALKDNDGPRIREHAADVANLAMMALDSWVNS